MMKELEATSNLYGANAPYVEGLYERWLADPASVDGKWAATFEGWQQGGRKDVAHSAVIAAFEDAARNPRAAAPAAPAADARALKVLQYIRAHRVMGSRYSQLDPLKRLERTPVPELELDFYGLAEADMDREFLPGSWQGVKGPLKLREIVANVKKTYCGTIGIEYMYISSTEQKRWSQQQFEGPLSTPNVVFTMSAMDRVWRASRTMSTGPLTVVP
jgi:2-oxoglutarate dehydrogenase E1 component